MHQINWGVGISFKKCLGFTAKKDFTWIAENLILIFIGYPEQQVGQTQNRVRIKLTLHRPQIKIWKCKKIALRKHGDNYITNEKHNLWIFPLYNIIDEAISNQRNCKHHILSENINPFWLLPSKLKLKRILEKCPQK